MVSLYQAPESAYQQFDTVLLLYQGHQIYFGPTTAAMAYFENLGFHCPERQTTADFLTSMTSPQERVVRPGFEARVPRTPEDFANAWISSKQRQQLMQDIDAYNRRFAAGKEGLKNFAATRKERQSKG